jgi:transposase InsO family protein
LKATAGPKRIFVKILDTATRDQKAVDKHLDTGKPCCFILPMALYGELFDSTITGNRIAFMERGTVAVLRNVNVKWACKIVSRVPVHRQPNREDRDEDTLLAMEAEIDESTPQWNEMTVPTKPLDMKDAAAIDRLIVATHADTYHAAAERVYPILAPVLPLGVPIPGTRVVKTNKTYWERRIRDTVKSCIMCPQIKVGRAGKTTKFGSMLLRPTAPHESMAMDVHTLDPSNEGSQYVLTVIDMSSRRVRLIKMKNHKRETVARALLDNFIFNQGTFKTWVSDHASEFVHAVVRKLCKMMGITQILCSPHSPWSRGVVKRVHKEVNVGVRTLKDPMAWPHVIKAIDFAINMTKHARTGVSPMEMEFLHPITHHRVHNYLSAATEKELSVLESLRDARDAMKAVRASFAKHNEAYVTSYLKRVNKSRHDVGYDVGERVLASRQETGIAANARRYCQTAEIIAVKGKQATVRYETDGKTAEVHLQHLIPLKGDALELTEEEMYGFEREVTPAIGSTRDDPLPEGTLVLVEDDEDATKVQVAEITGVHEPGGEEFLYSVHCWYSTTGKKRLMEARLHPQTGSDNGRRAPHQRKEEDDRSRRMDRRPQPAGRKSGRV